MSQEETLSIEEFSIEEEKPIPDPFNTGNFVAIRPVDTPEKAWSKMEGNLDGLRKLEIDHLRKCRSRLVKFHGRMEDLSKNLVIRHPPPAPKPFKYGGSGTLVEARLDFLAFIRKNPVFKSKLIRKLWIVCAERAKSAIVESAIKTHATWRDQAEKTAKEVQAVTEKCLQTLSVINRSPLRQYLLAVLKFTLQRWRIAHLRLLIFFRHVFWFYVKPTMEWCIVVIVAYFALRHGIPLAIDIIYELIESIRSLTGSQ